jgi:hypothetical protein
VRADRTQLRSGHAPSRFSCLDFWLLPPTDRGPARHRHASLKSLREPSFQKLSKLNTFSFPDGQLTARSSVFESSRRPTAPRSVSEFVAAVTTRVATLRGHMNVLIGDCR